MERSGEILTVTSLSVQSFVCSLVHLLSILPSSMDQAAPSPHTGGPTGALQ